MDIKMSGIGKAFGKNTVLKGVDFAIHGGEVHALMGENGAGKSTLMNILTGLHQADAGIIEVDGKKVQFENPAEAEAHGIGFIHQELNMWPDLTVLENLYVGKEKTKALGRLDKAAMRAEAKAIFSRMGQNIDLDKRVRDISIGSQQIIEIARALLADVQILIMDEPTTSLTEHETREIFRIIKDLTKAGVGVIYISHRMEEIFIIADRITVMRDGISVGTVTCQETDPHAIVKMMVGRELNDFYPDRPEVTAEPKPLLQVSDFNKTDEFKGVNFTLHAGEILGFSGLMGSGRTEVMRALFGVTQPDSGQVTLLGEKIHNANPQMAIEHGMGFVTENRKDEGLLLDFTIQDNIALASLADFKQVLGKLNRSKVRNFVEDLLRRLQVKTTGPDERVRDLSGGNQQKIVLAKWLGAGSQVLILDEPTKGVDVGAKAEIYELMRELASRGVGIIMVSSDLPEILGMSDRIVVMHDGQVAGCLDHLEATEEKVMTLATGGTL